MEGMEKPTGCTQWRRNSKLAWAPVAIRVRRTRSTAPNLEGGVSLVGRVCMGLLGFEVLSGLG